MPLNLDSVNAKLKWAERHAQAVRNEIRAWLDKNPYAVTQQVNADATRYSLILRINIEPAFEEWSLRISDAIHCLRCALDHLIYSIAVYEAGQDPPPNADKLMFPISDSPDKFAQVKWHINTLSPSLQTVIESLQPYNRTRVDLPPVLSIMRDFNNTDKHKLLKMAFTAPTRANMGFVGDGEPSFRVEDVKFFAEPGELKDGTEVAALIFPGPAPNMKLERHELTMVIALTHAVGPQGNFRTDCAALLSLIGEEVDTVIKTVVAAVK